MITANYSYQLPLPQHWCLPRLYHYKVIILFILTNIVCCIARGNCHLLNNIATKPFTKLAAIQFEDIPSLNPMNFAFHGKLILFIIIRVNENVTPVKIINNVVLIVPTNL